LTKATSNQVGGDHYKILKIQPIELAYQIGGTPAFLNICKYITRNKNDKIEDLAKALHFIELENQFMEQRCQRYVAEVVRYNQPDIKKFAKQFKPKKFQEFVNKTLQDFYFGDYKKAASRIAKEMGAEVKFEEEEVNSAVPKT